MKDADGVVASEKETEASDKQALPRQRMGRDLVVEELPEKSFLSTHDATPRVHADYGAG